MNRSLFRLLCRTCTFLAILVYQLNIASAQQTYLYPGVYVEEISTGARPIQPVATSVTAFLGIAPDPEAKVGDPTLIGSWSDFLRYFGGKEQQETTLLAAAIYGYFQNDGMRCYVVNLGKPNNLSKGLTKLEKFDDISIVAAPGYTKPADYEDLLTHCEKMIDRIAILDCHEDATNESVIKDRPRNSDRGMGAFYFPWIKVRDPFNPESEFFCPPSGHIAGIYARTDQTRGVHKAPANEAIRGALNLAQHIDNATQGELTQRSINAIRHFPPQGIRVFGARTLSDPSSEWRYINVRRLGFMIEESIAQGTRWAIFEPNDVALWQSLRHDTSAFLNHLWQGGALMGATPEDAFFVKCDQFNNWQETIDQGLVRIEIGVSLVKPSEFIIFGIEQHVESSAVSDIIK